MGDQSAPPDRTAAKVQLGPFVDVVLGVLVPVLAECLAGKVFCDIRVREAADIVDVGRVEVGARLKHENPLVLADSLGEVIRQDSAAKAGADDDQVEIIPRPLVRSEETSLRRGLLRDKVLVRGG